MSATEIDTARRLLAPHCVRSMAPPRTGAPSLKVNHDYDGSYIVAHVKPFGTHRVFSSLDEVRRFVADCKANDVIDCDYRSGVARTF